MSAVKTPERIVLDVLDALHAICSTGKGRCWYCDRRLPRVEEAVRPGWDVQRVEGERVASIILVCPRCQVKSRIWNSLSARSPRACNPTCCASPDEGSRGQRINFLFPEILVTAQTPMRLRRTTLHENSLPALVGAGLVPALGDHKGHPYDPF